MKLTLSSEGLQNTQNGIKGIFSMLAQAPLMREQAQTDAALKAAQTYQNQTSGDYNAARAGNENYTLEQRKGVESRIADANMPEAIGNMYRAFQLGGDTNVENLSKAGLNFQKFQSIDDIQKGANPFKASQAYFATSGSAPFDDVSNTGYSLNRLTGEQIRGNSILADLFRNKTGSEINENNGQAYSANASGNLANAREANLPSRGTAQSRVRAKNASAPSAGNNASSSAAGLPPGYKQVGTAGGKPVYQAPNGKQYILE